MNKEISWFRIYLNKIEANKLMLLAGYKKHYNTWIRHTGANRFHAKKKDNNINVHYDIYNNDGSHFTFRGTQLLYDEKNRINQIKDNWKKEYNNRPIVKLPEKPIPVLNKKQKAKLKIKQNTLNLKQQTNSLNELKLYHKYGSLGLKVIHIYRACKKYSSSIYFKLRKRNTD